MKIKSLQEDCHYLCSPFKIMKMSINLWHKRNTGHCGKNGTPKEKSMLILQCKRCQEFNHTQKYCQLEPRCVKCAGKHFTKECRQNKSTPPKCVNCDEMHPANYRGCVVAKTPQKRRNHAMMQQK